MTVDASKNAESSSTLESIAGGDDRSPYRVAIIPARGGSKRIPRKNIKHFAGLPIIAYSIQAALASECFERVIVSTDDDEIAEVARTFGAETPFSRPAHLADDYCITADVIEHAVTWLAEHDRQPNYVCCLYATAPFVSAESLREGYKKLVNARAKFAFSATSFPFPIQRAIKLNNVGEVSMFQPQHYLTRSQDLEEAYHDAGQFYWGTTEAFKERLPFFAEHSQVVLLPRSVVQDIDTEEDWAQAELLFSVYQQSKK